MKLVALAVLLTTACGLAHQAGSSAAQGATARVSDKMATAREADCPHSECVARAIVRGALAELDTPAQRALLEALIRTSVEELFAQASSPEQLAQMRAITDAAMRSAGLQMQAIARSAVDETVGALSDSLGDGDGPLAKSLAATAQRVSAATVRGLRDELTLFPECTGAERSRCVEEHVTALSRAASTGVREGMHGVIAIPSLALAFMTGVTVALLLSLLVSHHRPRPASSDSEAPRRAPASSGDSRSAGSPATSH